MITRNEYDIAKYASQYLKESKKQHLSPNTIHARATAISMYYNYLDSIDVKMTDIPELPYTEQNEHFKGFISWILSGNGNSKGHKTRLSTAKNYVRNILAFYRYLSSIKVLQPLAADILASTAKTYDGYIKKRMYYRNNLFRGFDDSDKDQHRLTDDEYAKILNTCDCIRARLIISIMGECGLRVGELRGIQVRDIRFDKGYLQVVPRNRENTVDPRAKFAEGRSLAPSPSTMKYIEEYVKNYSLAGKDYLFNMNGKPLTYGQVSYVISKLKAKTGIDFHCHSLRHYFAETRKKAGWDIDTIRECLGQRFTSTTEAYIGDCQYQMKEAQLKFWETYGMHNQENSDE